jgi:sporulation protein YqfC
VLHKTAFGSIRVKKEEDRIGEGGSLMRKWVSDWLDLPAEVTDEVPRIEMVGSRRLQIENYLEVEKFNSTELKLKVKEGILQIKGEKLKIAVIYQDGVRIEGDILELRYMK